MESVQAPMRERPGDIRSTGALILSGLTGGYGVFHSFTQSFLVSDWRKMPCDCRMWHVPCGVGPG